MFTEMISLRLDSESSSKGESSLGSVYLSAGQSYEGVAERARHFDVVSPEGMDSRGRFLGYLASGQRVGHILSKPHSSRDK